MTAANIVLAKAGGELHVESKIKLCRLIQYFCLTCKHYTLRGGSKIE